MFEISNEQSCLDSQIIGAISLMVGTAVFLASDMQFLKLAGSFARQANSSSLKFSETVPGSWALVDVM